MNLVPTALFKVDLWGNEYVSCCEFPVPRSELLLASPVLGLSGPSPYLLLPPLMVVSVRSSPFSILVVNLSPGSLASRCCGSVLLSTAAVGPADVFPCPLMIGFLS